MMIYLIYVLDELGNALSLDRAGCATQVAPKLSSQTISGQFNAMFAVAGGD